MSVKPFKEESPRPTTSPVDISEKVVIGDGPAVSEKKFNSRSTKCPDKLELTTDRKNFENKFEVKNELDLLNHELRLTIQFINLKHQFHQISTELQKVGDKNLMLQSQLKDERRTVLAMKFERADLKRTLAEKEKLCEELTMKLIEAEVKLLATNNEHSNEELFKKAFENDLLCTICSEIFIKPVTLSCSHSFCEHCINKWKNTNLACPICRTTIFFSVYSLTVNNFISQYMATMPLYIQENRTKVIAERQVATTSRRVTRIHFRPIEIFALGPPRIADIIASHERNLPAPPMQLHDIGRSSNNVTAGDQSSAITSH